MVMRMIFQSLRAQKYVIFIEFFGLSYFFSFFFKDYFDIKKKLYFCSPKI